MKSFSGPMGAKRYPLEPLRRLRKQREDAKARELGSAIAGREAAEGARVASEAQRDLARARADDVRRGERALLEKGELSVRDMARGGAWEERARAEDADRERVVQKARSGEADARQGEARAKEALASARADAEVLARHEARHRAGVRRAEEARDEEAAAEATACAPRALGPPRGRGR